MNTFRYLNTDRHGTAFQSEMFKQRQTNSELHRRMHEMRSLARVLGVCLTLSVLAIAMLMIVRDPQVAVVSAGIILSETILIAVYLKALK